MRILMVIFLLFTTFTAILKRLLIALFMIQSSVPINRLVQICLTLLFAETDEFKQIMNQIISGAKIFENAFSKIPNCVLFQVDMLIEKNIAENNHIFNL